jgi:hypothetical protein
VRDLHTEKAVYTVPSDGGSLGIPINDGYECTRAVTFTAFTTPGDYYLFCPDYNLRSDPFVIL